jgi:cytochrome oxidase Cu insertion factor (SCO1/SenC/PrrC family)
MAQGNKKAAPLWLALAAVLAAGLGGWLWLWADRAAPPAASTQALVGGPFVLTDHTGARVTDQTFRGQYMLVFFGFTYCPDICPTELQLISEAMDRLKPATAQKITPVFITIDPDRDTPAVMAEYIAHFHPRLVGLTGTPEEIATAARAYRVYYQKAPGSEGDDYFMDHSAIVFLMGPEGQYLSHFSPGTSAEAMAARLSELVR